MNENHLNGTLDFNEELASIELINMNGSIISSANNSDTLTVSNLPKGTYVIRAKSHALNNPTIFKYVI